MRVRNPSCWAVFVGLALVVLAATGCAKKSTAEGNSIDGEVAKTGSFLAYEHQVGIVLHREEDAAARVDVVREACDSARFGACSVLEIKTEVGEHPDSSIKVRVNPKGVEPLVALAADSAEIGSRHTHAEDLADAVRDNARTRANLERRHAKLLELHARADLAVSDLLTLTSELSAIETALEEAEGTAAQHARRLETNLLEITFSQGHDLSRSGRVGAAIGETLDAATDGTAEAISALAYGLPFLLIAFLLALVWRVAWLRLTGWRRAESQKQR